MINTLEFVSANETKKKQPSFMNEVKEANETSVLIEENENVQDLLNIDNNQKQQQSNGLLPESNNKIKISSHDSYINSIGHMHVIGEVENNTPNIVQFVQVIATFYDNNNKVVGTSFTYTTPTDLEPSETAPFDLILTDASISIEQIERYTVKVSGR